MSEKGRVNPLQGLIKAYSGASTEKSLKLESDKLTEL